MLDLMSLIAWNIVITVPMAMCVALICRTRLVRHYPAARHLLWTAVLVKLVIPAPITIPILPAAISSEDSMAFDRYNERAEPVALSGDRDPVQLVESTVAAASALQARDRRASQLLNGLRVVDYRFWLATILVSASIAGTLAFWFHSMKQATRLRRLLRNARVADEQYQRLLVQLSRQFRLRTVPELVVVDDRVSPMLSISWGRATIVFPSELLSRLSADQLAGILAHELAHFVRRDYWSSGLAFLVTSVFWWDPVAWFARKQQRIAGEMCCDSLAIQCTKVSRKSYASTLLATLDLLTGAQNQPGWQVETFGNSDAMRRRFEMIANPRVDSRLPRFVLCLATVMIPSLMMVPVRAQVRPIDSPGTGAPHTDDGSGSTKPEETSTPTTQLEIQASETGEIISPITKYEIQSEASHNASLSLTTEQLKNVTDSFLTQPAFGQRAILNLNAPSGNGHYKLPDYLPAAHGNAVLLYEDHYFMLQHLGSPRKWRVSFNRDRHDGTLKTLWQATLTIPAKEEIRQGDTRALYSDEKFVYVTFVESEYANDEDIGIRVIDMKTGAIKHETTLLRDMSRYQWMADSMTAPAIGAVSTRKGTDAANGKVEAASPPAEEGSDSRANTSGDESGKEINEPSAYKQGANPPLSFDFAFPVGDAGLNHRTFSFFMGFRR